MAARRALVMLIALLAAGGLAWLVLRVLAPGGWTAAKLVMLASFLGTAPWTGLCVANALLGTARLGLAGTCRTVAAPSSARPSDAQPGHDADPGHTRHGAEAVAIAVTVRNEDPGALLPPLRQLLLDLDAAGEGHSFKLWLLSDTSDSAAAATEEKAIAAFRATDPQPDRIHYRRRAENTGFKAGNIMDFLDHHADGCDLMLVLDADSRMTAAAVLRLVRAMRADPGLGILQHLTVGLPAASAFPRLFQFGMRAGMRIWAAGQDWWQGNSGPYWGHNAVVRIAPFRAHCRLPLLPGGRPILSHDQVEAAMLRGAGWGVRVLVEEDGSAEANPPALPEFLRRDSRWLAGNLQYRHLLGMPGLRPMGRWQLLQAILLFANPPFYLVFLGAAAWAAATGHGSPFPAGPALALTLAWVGALYSPKLLGYLTVLASPPQRARYGGAARFAVGAIAEIGFSLLLDAVAAVAKTATMLRLACGAPARWAPQNRTDRGVSWREAARLCWPQTLLGFAVFCGFALSGWRALLWAAPFAGGLPAAIPFCVVTADPRFGIWLRRRQVAAIPEELAPAADPAGVPPKASALTNQFGNPAARPHSGSIT